MRIELTRALLSPGHSDFLRNSTNHFRMFLCLVSCFLRITVSLLYRSQAVSKIFVPLYPYLISEGRRIFRACNRHSKEIATFRKHVTKYKNIIRNSESHGDKILWVNSVRITKLFYQCTIFLYGVAVRCDGGRFSVLSPFIEKSMTEYIKKFPRSHYP